jgi:hypothetical protein
MKSRLILFTTWLNADPRRIRFITLAIGLVVALVSLISPEAAALAGEATGGS